MLQNCGSLLEQGTSAGRGLIFRLRTTRISAGSSQDHAPGPFHNQRPPACAWDPGGQSPPPPPPPLSGASGKSRTPLCFTLAGERRFGHFRPWSSASSAVAGRKWPPAGRGSGGSGAAWEARSRRPERLVGSGVSRRRRRCLVPDWKPVGVQAAWEPEDPGRAGNAGEKKREPSSARSWRAGARAAVPGSCCGGAAE